MLKIRFGALRAQSTKRKIFNLVGLPIAVVVLLEIFLRGLGFLVSLQALHAQNFWQSAPDAAYTILCIGDSWTAGQPAGNYPDDLQAALMKLHPGRRLRVVNAGMGGSNSSQALRRLTEFLPAYQPQMVIVMTGNNDHWNLSESMYWKFADQEMNAGNLWQAKAKVWLHALRVYKLYTVIAAKLTGRPAPNEFYYAPAEGQPAGSAPTIAIAPAIHHKQLEYNLLKFIELAQTNNFTLVLQTYFHFHGYQVNEIIRDVALSYHLPLVDNNLLFHEQIPVAERPRYLVPDGHPNAAGYQFITANILAVLQAERLMPGNGR